MVFLVLPLFITKIGSNAPTSSISIAEGKGNFNQFYYTFPSGLALDASKDYEFYFLVTDNDGIRQGKTAKSQVFRQFLLDDNQLKKQRVRVSTGSN